MLEILCQLKQAKAVEILDDFADTKLDYWVSGFGTNGTVNGVSRVLKEKSPATKIIVCEPKDAPMLTSGLPQPLAVDGSVAGSHPSFKPHPMQGWSPDFLPKLIRDVTSNHNIDELRTIEGPDGIKTSQQLAQQDGIFVGISGGATLAGALQLAREVPKGTIRKRRTNQY